MQLYMHKKCFFLVSIKPREILFEVIPYLDARNQADINLQKLRRESSNDLAKWENLFKQTFL